MLSALVTGANGFIGSHLACELVDRGFTVYAIHRSKSSKNKQYNNYAQQGKIIVYQGDVSTFDTSKLPSVDYVYHIAGKVSVWGKMAEFEKINFDGTKNIIKYAKSCGAKCFTYLSSVAVYGFYGYKNLKEDDEKRPFKNPYSLSKLKTETFVKEYATKNNLPFVIIRPGNVYGEYDFTSSDEIYRRVKYGKMMMSAGGKYESCWVYVKNLAEAIIFTSLHPNAHNTDYNVADGNTSLKDYLTKVAKCFGVRPKFTNFPAPLAKLTACMVEGFYRIFFIKKAPKITRFTVYQNCTDYSFCTDKLKSVGYTPKYSEDEAIQRTAEYFNKIV